MGLEIKQVDVFKRSLWFKSDKTKQEEKMFSFFFVQQAYAWKFWSKGIRVAGLFGLVKTWNVSFNLDVELYVKRESVGSQEWSKICYN